jgi:hypothetical protein
MSKRQFRLPGPALLISMLALALVLGGTAVAATGGTHADAKADTKLVKALAPSLSVKQATNATKLGGHAASFYAPAVLHSGQSESGVYALATGTSSGANLFEGFAFPRPLTAALDGSHVAWLNGTTTIYCPGAGQAAAGWLCVYSSTAFNVTPDSGHAVSTHDGQGGADKYGFLLAFDATASNAYSYGSWTVTAP